MNNIFTIMSNGYRITSILVHIATGHFSAFTVHQFSFLFLF